MFVDIFGFINSILGISLLIDFVFYEEMQYVNIWYFIVVFVMLVVILVYIYIGFVGMEGVFDVMGNGQVDLEWVCQYYDLWVVEVEVKQNKGGLL